MALVPCWQCRQPFYASCHDASCVDALCPYCEYAEPSLDDHLQVEGGRTEEDGADGVFDAPVTALAPVRARRPGSLVWGGQG